MKVNYPLKRQQGADNYQEQLSYLPGIGSLNGTATTGYTSLASYDLVELLNYAIGLLLSISEDAYGTFYILPFEMSLLMRALRTARKEAASK